MFLSLLQLGHTCGDHCWHAKELECKCSCGGRNHGVLNNGGEMPSRTRKIAGIFYELLEIGSAKDIEKRRMELTRACNHHWYFDPSGPFLAKPITPSQRQWPEVAAIPKADYILWTNKAQIQPATKTP